MQVSFAPVRVLFSPFDGSKILLPFAQKTFGFYKLESVLMSRSERHDVLEAKQKELKNWKDRDVYEEENKDSFIKNRFTNNL